MIDVKVGTTMQSLSLKVRRAMTKQERRALALDLEKNRLQHRKKRYAPAKDFARTRGWQKSQG